MKPVFFHCVYHLDPSVGDFVLGGVFSKRSDAESLRSEIAKDKRFAPVVIDEKTLEGLKRDLLADGLKWLLTLSRSGGLTKAQVDAFRSTCL